MKVDYDQVAPTYDERYRYGDPAGIPACLHEVAGGAARVLEVGCGTGHWLAEVAPHAGFACGLDRSRGTGHWLAEVAPSAGFACGLDRSRGMLDKARATGVPLVHGDACALPFRAASVDAVLCVNALHHFPAPRDFVFEAARLLRPGGRIAVIGMDPSAGLDRWYLYDCFPGTLAADRARYPSAVQIAAWMENAGLAQIRRGIAARIQGTFRGRDVYADPILSKNGTSQLTLLSDEAFAAGMARIEAAIEGETEFVTDISLAVVTATR